MLKTVVTWFFRSPLGIGSIACGLLGAVIMGITGSEIGLIIGVAFIFPALGFFLSLVTKQGVESLVREKAAESRRLVEAKVVAGADARKAMSILRIESPELSSIRDRVVLESGRYLEICYKKIKHETQENSGPLYDPASLHSILDAREILDATLRELDEHSISRRFNAVRSDNQDHDPENNSAEKSFVQDAIEVLDSKISDIIKGRELVSGTIELGDMIAIEKELR